MIPSRFSSINLRKSSSEKKESDWRKVRKHFIPMMKLLLRYPFDFDRRWNTTLLSYFLIQDQPQLYKKQWYRTTTLNKWLYHSVCWFHHFNLLCSVRPRRDDIDKAYTTVKKHPIRENKMFMVRYGIHLKLCVNTDLQIQLFFIQRRKTLRYMGINESVLNDCHYSMYWVCRPKRNVWTIDAEEKELRANLSSSKFISLSVHLMRERERETLEKWYWYKRRED